MKLLTALLACLSISPAFADTYVSPYVRSDGTYVQGHNKTDANSTRTDNYSTRGNTNPYTGERGSQDPYASTRSNSDRYSPPAVTPNPYDTSSSHSNSRRGW